MKEKYGKGSILENVCQKCGYTDDLPSAGVHETENGCIRVYASDEKFICPMCPAVDKSDEG